MQQENRMFSLPLTMSRLFLFNATHLTVDRNYVKIAVNIKEFPILSIVADTSGESNSHYVAIGT